MQEALIGLVGLLIGILVTEYFRRSSRVEIYAKDIFQKRLKVYGKLYELINHAQAVSTDIMESQLLTKGQREDLWSDVVLSVAHFNDSNKLYLNEEISIHSMMMLIGVEDIFYIRDKDEQEKQKQAFRTNCVKCIEMIRKECGLEEIEKHFGKITRAKHKSDFIDVYREMRKRYKKVGTTGIEDTNDSI